MKIPAYLKNSLQPGEQVLFHSSIHPAFMIMPTFWTLLFEFGALKLIVAMEMAKWFPWVWLVLLLPALYFLQHLVTFLTAESAITTHRVVAKIGLIARNISEIGLGKIESSAIRQGIIGRMFGFGDLVVRGSGGHSATGIALADVMKFRAVVQTATNPPAAS
jgi:uncharacterized membrane protein YdbT with pleckstrin-like domain